MNKKNTYIKDILIIIFIILSITIIFMTNKKEEKITYNQLFTSLPEQIDIMSLHKHNEILYAGTPNGLFKLSGSYPSYKLEKVNLTYDLTFIRSIFTDNKNNLWIGSSNGLLCISPDNKEILYTQESGILPDNRINSITQTSDNSLWVATWGGAACINEDGSSNIYTKENGLLVDMVNIIIEDKSGALWFASYNVRGGGISYLKNSKFHYFIEDNGLANINTTSFLFKDDNTLWIGSGIYESGGITVFSLSNNLPIIKKIIDKNDGLAGMKVRSIYNYNNTIIIGSEYDGITIWDDKKEIYTTYNGLPHNEVKSFEIYDNKLFLGTRAGLCFSKEGRNK